MCLPQQYSWQYALIALVWAKLERCICSQGRLGVAKQYLTLEFGACTGSSDLVYSLWIWDKATLWCLLHVHLICRYKHRKVCLYLVKVINVYIKGDFMIILFNPLGVHPWGQLGFQKKQKITRNSNLLSVCSIFNFYLKKVKNCQKLANIP